MFPSGSLSLLNEHKKMPLPYDTRHRRIYLSRKSATTLFLIHIAYFSNGILKNDKRYNPTKIISVAKFYYAIFKCVLAFLPKKAKRIVAHLLYVIFAIKSTGNAFLFQKQFRIAAIFLVSRNIYLFAFPTPPKSFQVFRAAFLLYLVCRLYKSLTLIRFPFLSLS